MRQVCKKREGMWEVITEIEKLQANQSREFNIYLNDEMWFGPVSPTYLYTTTVTVAPIVDTIMKIKSTYGVNKHWQGDPCAPKEYSWDGLKCSYNGYDPPRIVSLNLSSSGLTGNIAPDLVNLTSIQNLNLKGNNLTGSLLDELVQRLEDSSLLISCDGNPNLRCHEKKKNMFIVPLAASAAAILFTLLIALAIWLRLKRRKEQAFGYKRNDSLELKSRSFAYSEIIRITDNFKRFLAKEDLEQFTMVTWATLKWL